MKEENGQFEDGAPVKTEYVKVTPELAKRWLSKNRSNRKVSRRSVQRYVSLMKRGAFRFTPQGIAFNENDELIDGQHRLMAIVESGIPQKMMVTWCKGYKTALLLPIDLLPGRNTADNTGMSIKDVALVKQFICAVYGPVRVEDDEAAELWSILGPGTQNMTTTCARHLSSAPIRAAVALRNLSDSHIDWSEQYDALVHSKYREMHPSTEALYRKLLQISSVRGHMETKRNFALAWRASDPERKNQKTFPNGFIESAIQEARSEFQCLSPHMDEVFFKRASTFAGMPHSKNK